MYYVCVQPGTSTACTCIPENKQIIIIFFIIKLVIPVPVQVRDTGYLLIFRSTRTSMGGTGTGLKDLRTLKKP